MKKRAERLAGSEGTSRQASVAPSPASVAPEPTEKAPTKKELKKNEKLKVNDAISHRDANTTTAKFIGGGSGMFGKKKKYSWMTGGAAGTASGASTPGRAGPVGAPSTPGGPAQPAPPEKLTADAARRLGTWREDKDKGRGIQVRDWIAVLEEDGREKRALQWCYLNLDQTEPK